MPHHTPVSGHHHGHIYYFTINYISEFSDEIQEKPTNSTKARQLKANAVAGPGSGRDGKSGTKGPLVGEARACRRFFKRSGSERRERESGRERERERERDSERTRRDCTSAFQLCIFSGFLQHY